VQTSLVAAVAAAYIQLKIHPITAKAGHRRRQPGLSSRRGGNRHGRGTALTFAHPYRRDHHRAVPPGGRNRKVASVASERFRGGESSYLEVLDAERSLFESELSLTDARRDRLLAVVQAYRALGGGWK
jgi:hypothetical protein